MSPSLEKAIGMGYDADYTKFGSEFYVKIEIKIKARVVKYHFINNK